MKVDTVVIQLEHSNNYALGHVKLLGMRHWERLIRSIKRAGYQRVLLFGSDQRQDQIKATLNLAKDLELSTDFFKSASALEKSIRKDEPCLVIPSSLFLDTKALQEIRNRPLAADRLPLVVTDARFGDMEDLRFETKVKIENAKVVGFGREENRYNTLSMGVFVLRREELPAYFKDSSVFIAEAMKNHQFSALELNQGLWKRVRSEEERKVAERVILRAQRKPTDNFLTRHLNRPVSLLISKYLVRLDVGPDVVSFFVVAASVLSPFFLIQGEYWGFVLGAFFYQVASVLDGCDGEIARLKFRESKRGEWMDTIADTLSHVFFFCGLIVGLTIKTGSTAPIFTGVIGFIGLLALLYTMFQYLRRVAKAGSLLAFEKDFRTHAAGTTDFFTKMAMLLKPLVRRATFAWIFLGMAFLGLEDWILFLFALGTNVSAILIYVTFRKQLRLALDREQSQPILSPIE